MHTVKEHRQSNDEKQTIAGLFFRQAAKTPHAPAVFDDQALLTYEQLADRANAVAGLIVQKTGRSAARVCILAPQNISAVSGILGVLKAGKCFVPMLPQESDEYLRYLWENSESSLIACGPDDAKRAASICGDSNLVIAVSDAGARPELSDVCESSDPDDISAIMYTSGSMGQPKGVMTTGRAILDRTLQHIEMAGVTKVDRQASVVPWQFAASFPDIFAPLLTGAGLFLYDSHRFGMDHLGPWIAKHGITLLKLPSALVRRFADHTSAADLTTIRYVHAGGGAVKTVDARALLGMLPDGTVLMNGFGSTETNLLTWKHWRQSDELWPTLSPEDTLPAGYPVSGKTIQIVDDDGHPVGIGEEGELVAVGRNLFAGYWKQPDMTVKYLKTLPEGESAYHTGDLARMRKDGCLEIIGRQGHRVKIRGLRIDLEAVDSLLRSLPYVRDAAAVAFSPADREARLVAYLETGERDTVTSTQLREDLKRQVPGYMIPSRFIMMDALPRTASGKIDRSSLPAPGRERPALANAYEAPRSDLERLLADIWAEVLDIDDVGIHDHFMEMGGDSLMALEIETRLQQELDITVPISRLLQAATIAQMAEVLGNPEEAGSAATRISIPFTLQIRNFLHYLQKKLVSMAWRFETVTPSYAFFLRSQKKWISLPIAKLLYGRKISVFSQWLHLTHQVDESGKLSTRNLMANVWFVGREFMM